jgi:hypothetical protein
LFNNNAIAGATSSSYAVTNAQPTDAGPYSVIVSNYVSAVLSSNALLTVIVAPAITNPPQSLTVTQGLDATFSVGASGSAPLGYQWIFNSGNIPGATASSYTRTNVQPADAGPYSVVVSNPAGSATSSPPANLTVIAVPTPPSITAQPTNRIVGQGTNATFSVSAIGSAPLFYQWYFNGSNLPGATASSYTRFGAQPADAGAYSVIVSNSLNTAASSNALLTVIVPPIINVQPVGQLIGVSNAVSFSVGLSQGTTPSYQWSKNGTPLAGATLASFSISSVMWSNAGAYSVVVSNFAGSRASSNGVLTVEQAAFSFFDGFESYNGGGVDNNQSGGPNANPADPWWALNTTANGWVTNASAGVTPHGGSQMLGTTNSLRQDYLNLVYRLNAGQLYYGNFLCDWWFYDPYGTSIAATNLQEYLAIAQFTPVSTTSDTSTFTAFNQRMSLGTFNSSGYNYSNYQARIVGATGGFNANGWFNTPVLRSVGWHHARMVVGIPNSANTAPVWMYLDNMTNATFSYPTTGSNFGFNLIELNHAMYKVGYGGYYDDLTFRAANDPWIVEQPVAQTVTAGQSVAFNTVAVGTAYQWQFNGTNIGGATSSAYSLASAAVTNAGNYACLITGTNGTISTSNAVLTVKGPPFIIAQPDSLTVTQGQSATFSVNAGGTTPLIYQWSFNSNALAGATSSSLTITNAQSTNAGAYLVVVTNVAGSAASSNATLTVLVPPVITLQPLSQTNLLGNCATFTVAASGTAPLFYQWTSNSTVYPPDTNSTSFTACIAGSYSVTVSNLAGVALSDTVTLSFTNPPPSLPGHFDLISVLPDGSVQLTMSGSPNTNYTLLAATNWDAWAALNLLPSSNGLFQYTDTTATNSTQRFYRLKLGP